MMKFSYSLLIFLVLCACSKEDVADLTESLKSNDGANIVLIIADDMGWDTFGTFPEAIGQKALTPTIDSLAQQGVTFSNFWVYPECAPTRAALLTGKYGFRTGIGGVVIFESNALAADEVILHQYIKSESTVNYNTALIGKWHISDRHDLTAPERFGIDYFAGFISAQINDYFNWEEISGGSRTNINTYATTHITNQAINWVEQQQQPFFLCLSYNAPHSPFQRPPLDLISNQSLGDDTNLELYLASIEAMDTEINRFLNSLSPEVKENTTFIFLGDNGTPTEVTQMPYTSNTGKNSLFQGGIHTPLIISGAGVSRENSWSEEIIEVTDIFATIADLASTNTTFYEDGRSFKSLLTGDTYESNEFIYSELFEAWIPDNNGYTVRNDTYKYLSLDNGEEYFFNLIDDPFESENLIEKGLTQEQFDVREAMIAFRNNL